MPAPLSPSKRAAIVADIKSGEHSRNAIARTHGVAGSTVGAIAEQEGITGAFDRTALKEATAAAQADAAAVRAADARRWHTFSGKVLASLERLTPDQWAEVSAFDRARIAGIAVDKALVLTRDDGAAERDAGALIAGLVEGLRQP